MNFDRPDLCFQPNELGWIIEDMQHSLIEQTQHVADELRGYLVHVDTSGKRGTWLRYDSQRKEWAAVKTWQVLELIHVVTFAWYKAIKRTEDPKLIMGAIRFSRMTAARKILALLPAYLPAHPSNFVPAT